MDTLFNDLKDIIEKQIQLLKIIKTVEKTKNEILKQGQLMDFSGMNENLSSLIEENSKFEMERERITQEILKKIDVKDKKNITFKEIINLSNNDKIKIELNEIRETLRDIVTEIKNISKVNNELIEVVMQVIDLTLTKDSLTSKDIDYTETNGINKERPLLINQII